MNLFSSIELFVKTIEVGSFSELGRQLHMAPSSISRQINALEEELGVRLLQRTTRNINLTEAGQVYYDRVSKILVDLDEAQLAISQLQATPRGVLRMNVAVPFGERIIVPLISGFLSSYPDLNIDLTLEDRAIDLVEGRVDLAIRIGRLADSSIVARRLADNHFVVCASKRYLDLYGYPATPEDLARHNCIVNRNISAGNAWEFRKDKSVRKIVVTGNFQANSGGALYSALLSNLGIAALPTWYVGEDIKQGKLCRLFEEYEMSLPAMSNAGIFALYPAGQYLPPKVRVFIDYLLEKLEL